jgi:enoyl-CoA hydratase/carnithine racemase
MRTRFEYTNEREAFGVSTEPASSFVEGRLGIIELNRPEQHNCLSTRTFEIIREALDRFEKDDAVKVVLVRSHGKNFCTGADLIEVEAAVKDRDRLRKFISFGHEVLKSIERSPLPVVGAVQGLCLAGGLELALSCDVVFAARTARFGDQHARFGLIPGWGGSQRLPRAIGVRRALDLCLSARWISADEALAWGLVNFVAADDALIDEAKSYGNDLAQLSASGLATVKRLVRDGNQMSLDDGLRLEVDTVVDALQSPDAQEGLAAFKQRRTPRFG